MTLQELIDELSELPASARTATLWIDTAEIEMHPTGVRYEHGEVFIEAFEEASE